MNYAAADMAQLVSQEFVSGNMDAMAALAEREAESTATSQKRKFVAATSSGNGDLSAKIAGQTGEIDIDDIANDCHKIKRRALGEFGPGYNIAEKSVPAAVFGTLAK